MKQYHTEILIDAPAEKVWRVLTDFEQYPEWNPLVGWLKGDFRTGGTIQMFIKPLNSSFKATLKQVEINKEFTWIGVRIASWILSNRPTITSLIKRTVTPSRPHNSANLFVDGHLAENIIIVLRK